MTIDLENAIITETESLNDLVGQQNQSRNLNQPRNRNPNLRGKVRAIKTLTPNEDSMTIENYIAETIKTHCLKQWF